MAEATTTMPDPALLATVSHPAGHGTICASTLPRRGHPDRLVITAQTCRTAPSTFTT